MKLVKKYPALGSSADPSKVSLTVKGVGLGLIPLIIIVSRQFNIEVTETELVELVEALTTAISVVMVLYGIMRKFWSKFSN